MNKTVVFLGAGAAAEAILSGVVKADIVKNNQIFVTNKNNKERLAEIQQKYHVQCTSDKVEAVQHADIIFLAMKPYDLQVSLEEIKDALHEGQLVISILAGVSTKKIEEEIGLLIPVIRVMPNTSASIGFSATALSKGTFAKEEHMEVAEELFQTVGITAVVPEDQMHAITAISGSGPAYFYYMVEAMEKAAIEAGLDEKLSKEFVTQTVLGVGNMLKRTTKDAKVLRKEITSPNGTTEAGIHVLEENHFSRIVMECVKRAKKRSEELGGN